MSAKPIKPGRAYLVTHKTIAIVVIATNPAHALCVLMDFLA